MSPDVPRTASLPFGSSRDSLVIHGGVIRSLAAHRPTVEAVGTRGDRIVAVGSRDSVERVLTDAAGHRPRIVDLEGACLLPGFVDAHTHLGGFGLLLSRVDLDGAESLEQALERVAHYAESVASGDWVLGGGWNKNLWGERFPSRDDLDRAVPARPVALHSKDGHCWWLSTEALRRIGVGRETPDPTGGRVERDAQGEPTGILKENAGGLVQAALDPPSPAEWAAALAKAVILANRLGLVGSCNMEGRDTLKGLQSLERAGRLTMRVWSYVPAEQLDRLADLGLESGFGGRHLKIAGVKAFLDGALGSQTADMLTPYEGSDARGVEAMTTEAFSDLVERASAEGLAVAVHAIGDRANRRALDAFQAHAAAWRAAGLRHRMEHLQLVDPDDIHRVGRLGLVASMQPIHASSDRDVAERYWGPARSAFGYAWRAVAEGGAVLAFGSDVPVESCDPLQGLYAAVTRRHPADPNRPPWHPEQAVSPLEAVRAFTLGSAFSVGEETERGTIEPGKVADFVILSEDILSETILAAGAPTRDSGKTPASVVAPEVAGRFGDTLLKTRVLATIVGGEFVYVAD